MNKLRIGQGFDIHRFKTGDSVILGGISIPYEYSLDGHSDADVLTHAIMDALLGAAGLADIGTYFPNTDPKYKGVSSLMLLKEVHRLITEKGWQVENIDSTVVAEGPKVKPFVSQIKDSLATTLAIESNAIGVKATTAEKLGALGRGEGMSAQAVVLLTQII